MRVTAEDLMMGGWHCGWGKEGKKFWAFGLNPSPNNRLTFHEAARAYKGGMRDKV